jgi:hypothetical protein
LVIGTIVVSGVVIVRRGGLVIIAGCERLIGDVSGVVAIELIANAASVVMASAARVVNLGRIVVVARPSRERRQRPEGRKHAQLNTPDKRFHKNCIPARNATLSCAKRLGNNATRIGNNRLS